MVPPGPRTVTTAQSAPEALDRAVRVGTPVVCVAGSLFLVGDVLRHLGGEGDKPCPIEKGAASMKRLFS
jgi:hypothetical protein